MYDLAVLQKPPPTFNYWYRDYIMEVFVHGEKVLCALMEDDCVD